MRDFLARGWMLFPKDATIAAWIDAARDPVAALLADPAHAGEFRYGGTWFAGINLLPNDATGGLPGGPPLAGGAIDFLRAYLRPSRLDWDRGQISVCFPGYPKPMAGETAAAFAFRRERDAAHVDGLHGLGPAKRRYLREAHAFLLGIPLDGMPPGRANFVIWEGSHRILAAAFRDRLTGIAPEIWPEIDLTEIYQETRRRIFATAPRVEIVTRPGEVFLVHRLALHGTAPWPEAIAIDEQNPRRAVIYFRPVFPRIADWLAWA